MISHRTRFCILLLIGAGLAATGSLAGCSGSGGGPDADYDAQAVLLGVVFPDPGMIGDGPEDQPPRDAPLLQQISFEFSGRPDPDQVSRLTVRIQDENGLPAEGRFDVEGTRVTFTPRLPLRGALELAPGQWDGGGAGLRPGARYSVRVGHQHWPFVADIAPDLRTRYLDPADPRGVALTFETTRNVDRFFRGLEKRRPRLVETEPADGSAGVTPQLYGDPEDRFAPRRPFRLRFDAPVFPGPDNLRFLLVDLEDSGAGPAGLPLGVDVRVIENELEGAVVEVRPSGILPFGHLLSLEAPEPFAGISGQPPESPGSTVSATFTIAPATTEVVDWLPEDFEDTERRDDDASLLSLGELAADWNRSDSKVLQASFAFDGAGELGRFIPSPPPKGETKTILLDTSLQRFPLYDGSTPDAPAGLEVRGGVFHFTEIDVPKNVILDIRGRNPLVLTCTGEVKFGGRILLNGLDGLPDNLFDSGVLSLAGGRGGAGGGRGGESHPIIAWPPDQFSYATLVSPPRGGRGFGALDRERVGGEGGESGVLDHPDDDGEYGTDWEIDCKELAGNNDNGDQAAGGSGGSYLTRGLVGRAGTGNVRPDTKGGWSLVRKDEGSGWSRLDPGEPGTGPFLDEKGQNDFFGVHGELHELLGGQGGGGGGSRSEAYYCGVWCKNDSDAENDVVCLGGEWGNPPVFGDSVGDARGGSAGGGGGAVMIQSLETIVLKASTVISSTGGQGFGGENLGSSRWGGPAGGGSGGAIIVQSAQGIEVRDGALLDVTGGPAAGGDGGAGLVQLQPPGGELALVEDPSSIQPRSSWVDKHNQRNPSRFTPLSTAVSTWFDMGRTITRAPAGTPPVFEFFGLDSNGQVRTDEEGKVLDPERVDVRCDYLGQLDPLRPGQYKEGQEPRAHFIPVNAVVRLGFQGARAVSEGSREVDPDSITDWSPDPAVANGMQFVRWRVTFDIAADGSRLRADAPRPAVQALRIRARF